METIWRLEERFWTGDAAFYEQQLAPASLFVFAAPVGVLERAQAVKSIEEAPRWKSVHLVSRRTLRPASGVVQLVYEVSADRGGPESKYEASCSSTYVELDGHWKLTLHQQTPAATPR